MKEDARRWPRIETGLNADQAVAHYAQALLNVPVPLEVSAIGQHAVRVLRGQLMGWAQNVIRDQNPGADVERLMPEEPEQAQPDEPTPQPPRFLWQVTDALMAGKHIARSMWRGRRLSMKDGTLNAEYDPPILEMPSTYLLTPSDLTAIDWIIIEPPPDVHQAPQSQ